MSNGYITDLSCIGEIPVNSYLRKLPVIEYLIEGNHMEFNRDVTFLIGENGSGKSTLTEAIAVYLGFNPEGGSKNFNFSNRETKYELSDYLRIARKAHPRDGFFLRSESFYNVATNIEEIAVSGYGHRSLHEQSHGESFMALFLNRFRGDGLYILDEPEAALSPAGQLTLISMMSELVNNNSQFIISTHSPILLAYPEADIFELTDFGVSKVNYLDSGLYCLYKHFIDNPQQMIERILQQ
jgi:predicted ATPase